MGCDHIYQRDQSNPNNINRLQNWQKYAKQKKKPVIGILTISILSCFLQSYSMFSNSPYIIVNVSNQCFKRKIKKKGKAIEISNQKFQIAINSLKKINGRTLIIQVSSENIQKESEVGLGLIDLDFYLKLVNYNNQARCFINYGKKAAGYINLNFSFKEMQCFSLNFRINSFYVKLQLQTQQKYFVRIIVGQQILQTKSKRSGKDQTIQFTLEDKQQILFFKVPYIIKGGLLQLISPTQSGLVIVGQTKLCLQRFSKKIGQYSYIQNIYNQQQLAGTICFDAIKDRDENYKFVDCQIISQVMNRKIQTLKSTQAISIKRKNSKKNHNNQVNIPIQRWSSMGSSLKRFIPKKIKQEQQEKFKQKSQRNLFDLQIPKEINTKVFQIHTPTVKKQKLNRSDSYLTKNRLRLKQFPTQIQQNFEVQSQSGDVSVSNIKVNLLDDDNMAYRDQKDYILEQYHVNQITQDSTFQNFPRSRRKSQYLQGIDSPDKIYRNLENEQINRSSSYQLSNFNTKNKEKKNRNENKLQKFNQLKQSNYNGNNNLIN